jgi:carbonic anhydrase
LRIVSDLWVRLEKVGCSVHTPPLRSSAVQGGWITGRGTPPAAAALSAGNQRFVEGHREHPNQDAHRRTQVAGRQRPFALIFGCSDSRVAAEIIFDRGLGDLFVVRTAGHVVDNGVLGSIEFGVDLLEIPLVIVLGHDGCGAVAATMQAHASGQMPNGYIRNVVELVTLSVLTARRAGRETLDELVAEHSQQTAQLLVDRSAAIARRVADGRCAVVAMEYTLAEGRARLLTVLGDVGEIDAAATQ